MGLLVNGAWQEEIPRTKEGRVITSARYVDFAKEFGSMLHPCCKHEPTMVFGARCLQD